MGIRKKMAQGAFWLFIDKGGQQAASLVVFMLIVRLIGPQQYGLVALCGVFLSLAVNIVGGLADAVVSLRVRDDTRLSTLFWIVAACGALLSLLPFVAAPLFADVMGQPQLVSLLRSFAIIPVLLALAAVPTALVTAAMDFKVFALRTLLATCAGGCVGVVLAFQGFGAYALAAQQIAMYAIVNIVVWAGCGWRPRLLFKPRALTEILTLGLHQVGSSLTGFFEQQAPRLLLGSVFGPAAAGQYGFVMRICGALQEALVQPVLGTVYPAFASIREEREAQDKILGQLFLLFGAFLFPVIAGAVATAPVYVPLIFGRDWQAATPLLQLALVMTAAGSFSLILRDFLRAHKLIGAYFRLQVPLVVAGFVAAAAFVGRGVYAYMAVTAAVSFVSLAAYTALAARRTKADLWKNYAGLAPPLFAALVAAAGVCGFMHSDWRPEKPFYLLAANLALGFAIYAALYGALQFRRIGALIAFVRKMRGAYKLSDMRELMVREPGGL